MQPVRNSGNRKNSRTTRGSLVTRRAATRRLSCACWYRKAENTGEAAGPVVKEVIKAYYDKKNKKTQGQETAESKQPDSRNPPARVAATAPRSALKPEESAAVVPARASPEPRR